MGRCVTAVRPASGATACTTGTGNTGPTDWPQSIWQTVLGSIAAALAAVVRVVTSVWPGPGLAGGVGHMHQMPVPQCHACQ